MKIHWTIALMILFAACSGVQEEASYADDWVFDVENTGADCTTPEIPTYEELESIEFLPDPFQFLDGTRVTTINDWRCRRAEISALTQHFELGIKPGAPESVTTALDGDTLTVAVTDNGTTISFDARIELPSGGQAPYPAVIGIGNSSLNNSDLDSLGVAIIRFPNNDIGAQFGQASRGQGKFFEVFGADHTASALMAWAWGVSRLIDGLEMTPESQIKTERLAVTGCSRNGKGALMVGAFDERIALTIPQESGGGGASGWRVADDQLARGQNVQTLRQIVNENVWYTESFRQFSESVPKLPFDHHEIMGMVAPRALLVIEHSEIDWLGNESSLTNGQAAREIWKAMGIADRMGVSQAGGHGHCQFPDSQRPELHAFVKKFLLDDVTANTRDVVKTDGEYTADMARWAPWETPVLQ